MKKLIDTSMHLATITDECKSQLKYSQIIDSLMYVSNCMQAVIAYSICRLSI